MRRGVNSSPTRPSPQEMLARRSIGRSPSHKLPPTESGKANQQQADPASSAIKTHPSKGEGRWRRIEEALVAQPTNNPTFAEQS